MTLREWQVYMEKMLAMETDRIEKEARRLVAEGKKPAVIVPPFLRAEVVDEKDLPPDVIPLSESES